MEPCRGWSAEPQLRPVKTSWFVVKECSLFLFWHVEAPAQEQQEGSGSEDVQERRGTDHSPDNPLLVIPLPSHCGVTKGRCLST